MITHSQLTALIIRHSEPHQIVPRLQSLLQVEPSHYPDLFWGILGIRYSQFNLK
jgi:hypothetical protein